MSQVVIVFIFLIRGVFFYSLVHSILWAREMVQPGEKDVESNEEGSYSTQIGIQFGKK